MKHKATAPLRVGDIVQAGPQFCTCHTGLNVAGPHEVLALDSSGGCAVIGAAGGGPRYTVHLRCVEPAGLGAWIPIPASTNAPPMWVGDLVRVVPQSCYCHNGLSVTGLYEVLALDFTGTYAIIKTGGRSLPLIVHPWCVEPAGPAAGVPTPASTNALPPQSNVRMSLPENLFGIPRQLLDKFASPEPCVCFGPPSRNCKAKH